MELNAQSEDSEAEDRDSIENWHINFKKGAEKIMETNKVADPCKPVSSENALTYYDDKTAAIAPESNSCART